VTEAAYHNGMIGCEICYPKTIKQWLNWLIENTKKGKMYGNVPNVE
jgi:hypothetical protein